jgi:hypothetical protein
MTLTSRTVIALVIVLATLGCHGSSVPSSPSGALCASDASANELTQCERDVASGSAGLDAENVVRTARCVAEARSCGEATGCMAGAALRSGTTFLRDFTYGLTR